jgi:hypothetical protein
VQAEQEFEKTCYLLHEQKQATGLVFHLLKHPHDQELKDLLEEDYSGECAGIEAPRWIESRVQGPVA